jgi:adenylate cyclase
MITLDAIRGCLEGAAPAMIATSALDGIPNVAYLSQVHYVDEFHVALTFQFFNTTRRNILANPHAVVQVIDPVTAGHYRLQLEYQRTEAAGPLFESMKAKLAGIASHTGMSKVFRLQGADVYRVLGIERVFGDPALEPPRRHLLPGLRAAIADLSGAADLAALFDMALAALECRFAIGHAMLLLLDERRDRLYTVATRGYAESGVGSEIGMGEGIIGVAARERTPIRIGYAAQEYLYSRATRAGFATADSAAALECEIPFPGLAQSGSQLAVPLAIATGAASRLVGVLYVESLESQRYSYEDEDALVVFAGHLALAIDIHMRVPDAAEEATRVDVAALGVSGAPLLVRHFAADHSVFLDDAYLIKGVAGAICWKLVREHVEHGRREFTNRELRLDPGLGLPEVGDNLEARLILLQRRLAERGSCLAIEKTGRGRFRLVTERPLALAEVAAR